MRQLAEGCALNGCLRRDRTCNVLVMGIASLSGLSILGLVREMQVKHGARRAFVVLQGYPFRVGPGPPA